MFGIFKKNPLKEFSEIINVEMLKEKEAVTHIKELYDLHSSLFELDKNIVVKVKSVEEKRRNFAQSFHYAGEMRTEENDLRSKYMMDEIKKIEDEIRKLESEKDQLSEKIKEKSELIFKNEAKDSITLRNGEMHVLGEILSKVK